MSSKSDKIDKLLLEIHKLEKSFNERIDMVLHRHLPYHFGKNEFRVRGTNIYSQWVVDRLSNLIEQGEIDQKTLDALMVNGRPIHLKQHKKQHKHEHTG